VSVVGMDDVATVRSDCILLLSIMQHNAMLLSLSLGCVRVPVLVWLVFVLPLVFDWFEADLLSCHYRFGKARCIAGWMDGWVAGF